MAWLILTTKQSSVTDLMLNSTYILYLHIQEDTSTSVCRIAHALAALSTSWSVHGASELSRDNLITIWSTVLWRFLGVRSLCPLSLFSTIIFSDSRQWTDLPGRGGVFLSPSITSKASRCTWRFYPLTTYPLACTTFPLLQLKAVWYSTKVIITDSLKADETPIDYSFP